MINYGLLAVMAMLFIILYPLLSGCKAYEAEETRHRLEEASKYFNSQEL